MADIVKELKASAYTVASLAKVFQDYFRGEAKDIEIKYMDPTGEVKSVTIPNVRKLTNEIKAVSVSEDQLKETLKSYYTKDEIDTTVDKLKSKIDDETKKVSDDLSNKLESAKTDLSNKIKGVDSKLENTKSDLTSKINNVDKKVDEVSSNLDTKAADLDKAIKDTKTTLLGKVSDVDVLASAMTKEEFEAVAETRREYYAGSGLVRGSRTQWNGDVYSGFFEITDGDVKSGLAVPTSTRAKRTIKNALILDWYNQYKNDEHTNHYVINGVKLKVIAPKSSDAIGNTGKVRLPEEPLPVVEKDSSKLSKDYKQGDWIYLKEENRNILEEYDISDPKNWNCDRCSVDKDSDGGIKIKVTDTSYDFVNISFRATNKVRSIIIGLRYKIRVKIDFGTADYISFDFWWCNNHNMHITPDMVDSEGWYEFEIDGKVCGRTNVLFGFHPGFGSDISTDDYCYIRDLQVIPQTPVKLVVTRDVSAGSNVFKNAEKFLGIDSFSRQDLVFLETWHEDVTEKNVVYPYGNVQYNGGDTDGLSGITKADWFDGYDTYSLFGNWQNPGDLVGKGYKWSELSKEAKNKLLSNPEHNLYREGDRIIQVRYRIRVVKGLGNNWSFSDLGSTRGLLRNVKNSGYDVSIKDNAVPIALVQRRNPGIFHPVYNPEGCALVYDSSAKEWFEAKDDDGNLLIKSVEDCFNHDYIAVVNKDDHSDAARLSELEKGNVSADKYKKTGYIESMMSGRPDGLLVDEINERDVEDLRMNANPIEDYNQFLESEFIRAIRGDVRGKERTTKIVKLGEIKTDTGTFKMGMGANKITYSVFYYGDYERFRISGFIFSDNIPARNSVVIVRNKNNGSMIVFRRNEALYDYQNYHVHFDYRGKTYTYDAEVIFNNMHGNPDDLLEVLVTTSKYGVSYTQNNTYLQCDIIGDPRKLKDRVNLEVTNEDKVVNIKQGDYVLCSNADKNKGKVGHYYLALKDINNIHTNSDDGDANANNGHIDFSDGNVWTDLGNNGNLGGYPDEWLKHGIYGSPLIVGENGEDLTPIRGYFNGGVNDYGSNVGYHNGARAVYFKLSRKGKRIKEVIAIGKDGRYVKYKENNWSVELSAEGGPNKFNIDGRNHVFINIGNDKTLEALGFDNVKEALAEVVFLVYYETNADFLEITNNRRYYSVSRMFIYNYFWYNEGGLFLNKLISKVPVGRTNFRYFIPLKSLNTYVRNGALYPISSNNENIVYTFNINDFNIPNNYSPTAKFFSYLTEDNNRAQINIVFKELKWDPNTKTWGDDNKFQITDKVKVITDTNGNRVLYGQKAFKTNRFIKKS